MYGGEQGLQLSAAHMCLALLNSLNILIPYATWAKSWPATPSRILRVLARNTIPLTLCFDAGD
jgi:hypothetical protein